MMRMERERDDHYTHTDTQTCATVSHWTIFWCQQCSVWILKSGCRLIARALCLQSWSARLSCATVLLHSGSCCICHVTVCLMLCGACPNVSALLLNMICVVTCLLWKHTLAHVALFFLPVGFVVVNSATVHVLLLPACWCVRLLRPKH